MAISSAKVDIVWSPNHEDKFVTFGTDLSLYKVERTKTSSAKGQGMRIADGVHASLLSSNTNHQYMKCISWCPRRNPDHLIAVGQANGRVVLTSFGKGTGNSDPDDLIGKEFVPRHQRPCHALSWNPIDTNLLAEVLEKHKADNSIIIWDVNSSPASRHMMTPDRRHLDDSSITRSFIELGPAESTYSLCWFQHEPKTLVAGMNKYLKIFDLRDISRPQNMTVNKAVYCVSVDPHCEHRLASCHEGQILVWDVRSFDKPVLTFQEPRNVVKLSWCTARFGLLACLTKDSSVVKLFDVQHSGLGSDELEPAVIERMVHPYGQQVVSSFAWHPTHENRMLTVTPGGVIRDVSVFERISVTWSPSRTLLWSCGKRLIQCERVKKSGIEEDISVVMKKRANAGYGLKMNHIWENAYITDNNPQIQSLWHWLDLVGSLFDEGKLLKGAGGVKRVIGVNSFLRGDDSYVSCKTDEVADRQLEGYSSTVNTYRSDARAKSMQLCGWEFDKEYSLRCFIERLEADKQYERAAAIALFNLKLRMAIDVLKKGSTHNKKDGSINLSIVAMALSGYTDDKDALWREMCGTMTTQLMSPYIRAMFAFLTNESDNYKDVLIVDTSTGMKRRKFHDKDAPNLKRFRASVEQFAKQQSGGDTQQHAASTTMTTQQSDEKKIPRKQRRKQGRLLKKAKMNAFYHKKPIPQDYKDIFPEKKPEKKKKKKKKKSKGDKKKPPAEKGDDGDSEGETAGGGSGEENEGALPRAEFRRKQLMMENEREDKLIKRLEKQMKLNRRKSKNLPKSFTDDGLDYIFETLDSEKLKCLYENDGSEDDDGNDDQLLSSLQANDDSDDQDVSENDDESDEDEIDDKPMEKKKSVKFAENLTDEREILERSILEKLVKLKKSNVEEIMRSEGREEMRDEESEEEMRDEGSEEEQESEDMEDNGSDEDGSSEEESKEEMSNEEDLQNDSEVDGVDSDSEVVAEPEPELKEDIYGRLRDKDGNIVTGRQQQQQKYIPPGKRAELTKISEKKKIQNERLTKLLKGLINRVSESNMQPIANEIESQYRSHSRADMNETLYGLITASCISPIPTPERLIMELAMLVTVLHGNIGSEVGAYFLQNLAMKFDELFRAGGNYGEGKTMDNLVIFLMYMYNFKVVDSLIVFDIGGILCESFTEKSIELLVIILRIAGMTLRRDDALALKDIILKIQNKASTADMERFEDKSRVKFMLDILLAIKNNNVRKIPNYDPTHLDHLKKLLRSYVGGSLEAPLRISLDDLLSAESHGRWWMVGSAWSGKQTDSTATSKTGATSTVDSSFSSDIVELARKQRMNTDIRKNIFCIIMTSEDFVEAFEKLLKLGLKHQQEREIVHVITVCCLQEKRYNPYYGFLAQKFAEYDRRFQMTIQFNLWDKLKEISSLSEQNLKNYSGFLTHLIATKALSLSIFKVVEFGELDKSKVFLIKSILLGLLVDYDEDVTREVFQRVAPFPKLRTLRQGLKLFLQHFVLKHKSKLNVDDSVDIDAKVKLAFNSMSASDSKLHM
ncbi:uncharacterized protein LOC141911993 [Tubulanus polymorphus]|uniref:uncharacterized protein LOC141911993 n=1 Tax=Tubulanus polymorphus TaxID=672921 RepID=UPI003DA68317